jgi:hypothetical protein
MTSLVIEAEDIGETSIVKLGERETIAVYAASLEDATWNGAVLTLQVSPDGTEWFPAVTLNGATPETLTADGFLDDIYCGDAVYARLSVTTAASSSTRVEVTWP